MYIQGHTEEAEEGGLESKSKETYRAAMYSSRVLTVNLYNLKHKILLQLSLKTHFLSVVKKAKCLLYCPQLLVLWGSNSPHNTVQGMISFIFLSLPSKGRNKLVFSHLLKLWNVLPIESLSSTPRQEQPIKPLRGIPVCTPYFTWFFNVLIEGVRNAWLS